MSNGKKNTNLYDLNEVGGFNNKCQICGGIIHSNNFYQPRNLFKKYCHCKQSKTK